MDLCLCLACCYSFILLLLRQGEAGKPSYSTGKTASPPKVALSPVQECCKKYISEDCLNICHLDDDERKFYGHTLCRYRFDHVHDDCLHGRTPSMYRTDIPSFVYDKHHQALAARQTVDMATSASPRDEVSAASPRLPCDWHLPGIYLLSVLTCARLF